MSPGGSASAASLLHVRCGHDILAALDQAGVPGSKVAWADPLCEGPVPGHLDRAALRTLRTGWLAAHLGLDAATVAAQMTAEDAALAQADSFAEVVLWFEHDLYDQAILIWLLTVLAARVRAGQAVSLVCIGEHPEVPRFCGLGQLSPPALADLYAQRSPVTADQVSLAETAWAAYTAPTPEPLLTLLATLESGEDGQGVLPFLAPALLRHAQEFPWKAEGLSLSQWLALDCVDVYGALSGAEAFRAVQGREAAPWQGDLQFFAVLKGLAAWDPEPLLVLEGADWPRSINLRCTGAGQDVLLGKRDALDGCRREYWRGGVHLGPGRADWRWDAGAQTLITLT